MQVAATHTAEGDSDPRLAHRWHWRRDLMDFDPTRRAENGGSHTVNVAAVKRRYRIRSRLHGLARWRKQRLSPGPPLSPELGRGVSRHGLAGWRRSSCAADGPTGRRA